MQASTSGPAVRGRTKSWLVLPALLILMAPAGRSQKPRLSRPRLTAADNRWVDRTLRKMTLAEKLGQLLMVYYWGEFTSTDSPEYNELVREIVENHVGGLILGARSTPVGIWRSRVYPAAVLANQLQRKAKIPLLIGADFETGTAMRLDEGTAFPHAMGVAATGNPQDAYTVGRITALEARAAGIEWIFAPVADVTSNPDNPIINIRSYGEDPQRVAQFVRAFIEGAEEAGALATAKHFPGHGDTSLDSHLTLPVVTADRARLDRVDLVPFRAAIEAGVSSIMAGHLAVPALDADVSVPATISKPILTGLLREKLGFQGLVVTDALDMAGVTAMYPPGEVAVRSIAAGADVLLIPPSPEAALAALTEAVASGRLPLARVDDAVRRILSAKAHLGLEAHNQVNIDGLNAVFGVAKFKAAADDIADRGVTLLRDSQHALPLDATRPLRVLLVAISADPDPWPLADLEQEIRWRVDSLQTVRVDSRFARPENVKLPSPDSYDLAVVAPLVRVADRKGTVGLPDAESALVEQILGSGKPSIVAAFGSPYLIARFPEAKTWIAAFSTVDVAQRAVGRALFGQVPISGKLPVNIPGTAKLGDGIGVAGDPMTLRPAAPGEDAKLQTAYALLDRAVADRAFPGGVLAVGYRNELFLHPFGRLTYDAKSPAVNSATLYDAASLTKPVVTTTAIMLLFADGKLDLDAPVAKYMPEWATGPDPAARARVTVRNLLLHDSGLPAHVDFYREAKGRQAVLARVFATPLESVPGTRIVYSDLGFILLGEIVERLTGEPLDRLASMKIFAPLAMNDSFFNPPKRIRARIAPTENDVEFRKRLLAGEVDDANAAAMGGVAGHAGLFSTASDLAVFCQMMLNGGIYAHHRLLTRAEIREFTTSIRVGDTARTLGWDVPGEPSSSGRYFSASSYGHLGYTGTSMWIDPEKELFVVLLTNRVYPTAENELIRQVRPAVHNAVFEGLGLSSAGVGRKP